MEKKVMIDRRTFLSGAALTAVASTIPAKAEDMKIDPKSIPDYDKWQLTNEQWKERLEGEAYAVLRKEATERPWTSPLNDEKRKGVYSCAGCGYDLFSSEMKFESGTGWPSFFDHLPNALDTKTDFKLIVPRTEYHCARCGGHQGHVFKDGPAPSGLRYCNNGVALTFRPV
ncbi:MAG TPA: peptide-methionine (R)-S-oxide reductase MsrB [Parvularculaceae bacterium]|nr:peptide-methionine (R)-S-oxide reductase MsrB [Parvularculaceae bacterium]